MVKILKFESEFCPQCKALEPTLKRLAENLKGDLEIENIDIEEDEKQDYIRSFAIRSIPVLVFMKDGLESGRLLGNQPYIKILNKIKELSND